VANVQFIFRTAIPFQKIFKTMHFAQIMPFYKGFIKN